MGIGPLLYSVVVAAVIAVATLVAYLHGAKPMMAAVLAGTVLGGLFWGGVVAWLIAKYRPEHKRHAVPALLTTTLFFFTVSTLAPGYVWGPICLAYMALFLRWLKIAKPDG